MNRQACRLPFSLLLWLFLWSSTASARPEISVSEGAVALGLFHSFIPVHEHDYSGVTTSPPISMAKIKDNEITPMLYVTGSSAMIYTITEGPRGELFVGGSFTSINGIKCNNIGMIKNGETNCLDQGVNNAVSNIVARKISGGYQLIVSGSFSRPILGLEDRETYMPRMAIFQSDKNGDRWVPIYNPFNNGVNAMIPDSDNEDTYYVGGGFAGFASLTNLPSIQFISPSASANATDSLTGTKPSNLFDGSLSDEKDSIWLLPDGKLGAVDIDFGIETQVTRLRIANTRFEGRGTKFFRVSLDGGSIQTLDYYNIFDEKMRTCSNDCPLFLFPYLGFQDFYFSSPASGRTLTIEIIDFVGTGGGLREIEVYRQTIFVENNFNAENATITKTGTWTEAGDPIDSLGTYLSAVAAADSKKLKIVPLLPFDGYYSVTVNYCPSSSCALAQYKINYAPSKSVTVNSNDNAISEDSYFFVTTDEFTPFVEITVTNTIAVDGTIYYFDRMIFTPTANPEEARGFGKLDLSTNKITALNVLPENAVVNVLLEIGDDIFIGGDFENGDPSNSTYYGNIVAYNKASGKIIRLPYGGLNNAVRTMILLDDENILIGGEFVETAQESEGMLRFLTIYNIPNKEFSPLGYGVDGSVQSMVLVKDRYIHIVGMFTTVYNSQYDFGIQARGYAVYDWKKKEFDTYFLQTGAIFIASVRSGLYMFGQISLPPSELHNGVAVYSGGNWKSLNKGFSPQANNDYMGGEANVFSAQYMGAVGSKLYVSGYFVGIDYYTPTRMVAVYSGNKWKSVGSGFDDIVYVLTEVGGKLWAGGWFTHSQNMTSGHLVYMNGLARFSGGDWEPIGDQLNAGAEVYTIRPFGMNDALVGGEFDFAGLEVGCKNICHWDGRKWNSLNGGANSWVSDIQEYGGKFYVVGAFTTVGCLTTRYYAIWDGRQWIVPENVVSAYMPNFLVMFVAVDNEENIFLLNNNYQLIRHRPKVWPYFTTIDSVNANYINRMLLVPARNTPKQDVMSRGNVLLFVGQDFQECNFDDVSVAFFDGQSWYPYATTGIGLSNQGEVMAFYPSKNWSLEAWEIALIVVGILLFLIILILIIILCCLKKMRDGSGKETKKPVDQKNEIPPRPESAAPAAGFAGAAMIGGAAAAAGGDDNAVPLDTKQQIYRAKFDFTASEAGEVSFKEGDQITVTDSSNADWWQGSVNGEHGVFPADYVEPL